jgi:FkbM family methyltransferase
VEGHDFELVECRKIVFRDSCKVRHFRDGDLDFIFDIGANIGAFSVFMRMRHPDAKIVCMEPCHKVLPKLRRNIEGLNISLVEEALGNKEKLYPNNICDGTPMFHVFRETPQPGSYSVNSITFPEFFNSSGCKLSDRFLVKIDCEGGEKVLINDYESEEILKHAQQISMEVHFKAWHRRFGHTDAEWLEWYIYNDWVYSIFEESHEIEYYLSRKDRGYGHYCIKRKS